jgi:hypothetical protein
VAAKHIGALAERYASRPGGYPRVLRTRRRVGDNAEMSIVQLVEKLEAPGGEKAPKKKASKARTKKATAKKATAKKAATKKSGTKKAATKKSGNKKTAKAAD